MTRWSVPTHDAGPKSHPRVTTTRGWAFILSPTPPTSHNDSLVGFDSLTRRRPKKPSTSHDDSWVGFNPVSNTTKATHESRRLVGGRSSFLQHHQRVFMTRWWVSTPSHDAGPKNHPRVVVTRGWAYYCSRLSCQQ